MSGLDARHYAWFRAAFGSYLSLHFTELVSFGGEVWSSQGVLPDGSMSPLLDLFPNVLALCDSPAFTTALLVAGVVLAAAFALGIRDRIAAVALWYLLACLFGRNPLTLNPSLPFVGWLLLAHALIAPGPRPRSDPVRAAEWCIPQPVLRAAWLVMAAAYSYSGLMKLGSPSWRDGSALRWVLENPLARPTPLREMLLGAPDALLELATWGALALEVAFLPLALHARVRPVVWTAMLLMHGGLMLLVDFADLTAGMVILHAFTFDPAWLRDGIRGRPRRLGGRRAARGVARSFGPGGEPAS